MTVDPATHHVPPRAAPPARAARRRPGVWLSSVLVGVVAIAVTACSSSKPSSVSLAPAISAVPTTAGTASTPPPSVAAAPSAVAGSGVVPSSCSAIPLSVFLPYATVTLTQSFPTAPTSVSCEFAASDASTIIILNIGHGSAALFSALSSSTAKGGVTVTPISGLGVSAFTISRGGVVAGVDVLTARNVIVSVGVRLPPGQVEALARKLIARY